MPLPQASFPSSSSSQKATFRAQSLTDLRSSPLFQQRRRYVLVGAVVAITVAGALTGALLKSGQQVTERELQKQELEVETAKQLEILEQSRGRLLTQKMLLERKIEEVRERRRRKMDSEREREKVRLQMAGERRDAAR